MVIFDMKAAFACSLTDTDVVGTKCLRGQTPLLTSTTDWISSFITDQLRRHTSASSPHTQRQVFAKANYFALLERCNNELLFSVNSNHKNCPTSESEISDSVPIPASAWISEHWMKHTTFSTKGFLKTRVFRLKQTTQRQTTLHSNAY